MGAFRDITGQKFAQLLVVRRAPTIAKRTRWECLCDCGNTVIVAGGNLQSMTSKSCGCLNRERAADAMRRMNTTHGMSRSVEYYLWQHMVARCHNPKTKYFRNYGARGIAVCDAWRNSFEAFFRDMGPRPSKDRSLERINNDGDYKPGNVRWATAKEQQNNKRSNHRLAFRGRTQNLLAWCRELGLPKSTVINRLRRGWSVDQALATA